jgi:hypothetical protein
MSQDRIGPSSRYATVPRLTHIADDGTPFPYLRRRFVPQPGGADIGVHEVVEGDRPDTIAAARLGDAEQYWRVCDANTVMHPRDLTAEIGRRIRIVMPGVEGA